MGSWVTAALAAGSTAMRWLDGQLDAIMPFDLLLTFALVVGLVLGVGLGLVLWGDGPADGEGP